MEHNSVLETRPDVFKVVTELHGFGTTDEFKEAVDTLQCWVKNQQHFVKKDFPRSCLESTIISCKGSLPRAQERLERLCSLKTQYPQYFGEFDIKNDFKDIDPIVTFAILPKLTADFNRVLIICTKGKKFLPTSTLQYTRILIMFLEYMKGYDCNDGLVIVVDLLDVGMLEIIRRLRLTELLQVAKIVIEGYGTRLKAIHLLSTSRLISMFLWILKQLLSRKLVDRIHVHSSPKTLQNFMPVEMLPSDYDGKEWSLNKLNDEWKDTLSTEDFRLYLKEMSKACTDESCRIPAADAKQNKKIINNID